MLMSVTTAQSQTLAPAARVRSGVDKAAARRDELAGAALRTLAERGYANTSLRDVAQNSEYSHGVVHYYFTDKTDLITHCVSLYKARCVRRYDQVCDGAQSAESLVEAFIAALIQTMTEDTGEQRLWYDMRAQSLFEPAFREPVAAIDGTLREMVWRILSRYAELAGAPLALDAETAYALLDGLFQRAIQAHISQDGHAAGDLEARIRALLPRMLG